MLINLDKFMIEELNKRGFTCDYKLMVEIYKASRENPEYLKRKNRQAREEEQMAKIARMLEN